MKHKASTSFWAAPLFQGGMETRWLTYFLQSLQLGGIIMNQQFKCYIVQNKRDFYEMAEKIRF